MKRLALSVLFSLTVCSLSSQAQTIADWTFETSMPTTAGPFSPEVGAGAATGSHVGGTAVYSHPAGNGSTNSFSANVWAVGDYYQFKVSTVGLSDISISYDQTSSGTGPGQFQLEYSTDGLTFNNIGSAYTVQINGAPNVAWSVSTYNSLYTFSDNLSSLVAVNNDATLYFRLADASTASANGGTVGTAGTDRVDNFDVFVTPTPEPQSLFMVGGFGVLAWSFIRRRK